MFEFAIKDFIKKKSRLMKSKLLKVGETLD